MHCSPPLHLFDFSLPLHMQQCAEEEIHDNQEQQLFHTGHLLAAEQPFQLLHIESKLFVTVESAGAVAPGPHDVLSVRLTEGDAGSVLKLLRTPSTSPSPHATVPCRTNRTDGAEHLGGTQWMSQGHVATGNARKAFGVRRPSTTLCALCRASPAPRPGSRPGLPARGPQPHQAGRSSCATPRGPLIRSRLCGRGPAQHKGMLPAKR